MIESRLAKGSRILDVGCGTGHLAAELARRSYDTWGTDLSAGMIQYARTNYNQDRSQVGDIERIPFPDKFFDGIVCLGVVEHLASNGSALSEIHRVLRPGFAVITTPSGICPFFFLDRARCAPASQSRPQSPLSGSSSAANRGPLGRCPRCSIADTGAAVGPNSCAPMGWRWSIGYVMHGAATPWNAAYERLNEDIVLN